MNKEQLISFIKKYSIVLLFIFVGVVSFYFLFKYNAPYRIYNSDVFHQLAVLKSFDAQEITDPYFKNGPADLHGGPFYYALYVISKLTGVSIYSTILFAALFNILLLLCGLNMFAKSFDLTKKERILFILISLLGWGGFNLFFAGLYDFTNLLVTGSFPAIMGIGCILIILSLTRYFLKNGSPRTVILISLLSSVLLVSHLLSGVILFSFMSLMILENIVTQRRITRGALLLIIAISSALVLSLIVWPLFNLITLLTSSSAVQVGDTDKVTENLFAVSYWPLLLGLSAMGVIFSPYLIREKKYFLLLFVAFAAVMTASYVFPIRVSLYWRYFPFIFLGLTLVFAMYVKRLHRVIAATLIIVILSLGFFNVRNKINLLLAREATSHTELAEVQSFIPENAVLLSDPNTSYHLSSLYKIKSVAVSYNHANPAYIPESKVRYDETISFLMGSTTPEQQRDFLNKYEVEYVLIDKKYAPDFISLESDRTWLNTFKLLVPHEVVLQNDRVTLFKIKNNDRH